MRRSNKKMSMGTVSVDVSADTAILVMSTSAEFDTDVHCFTSSDESWNDFEMPGKSYLRVIYSHKETVCYLCSETGC